MRQGVGRAEIVRSASDLARRRGLGFLDSSGESILCFVSSDNLVVRLRRWKGKPAPLTPVGDLGDLADISENAEMDPVRGRIAGLIVKMRKSKRAGSQTELKIGRAHV